MEVGAIDEGIVAVIAVPEGSQNVPVNAVIAMLAEEGEDPKAIAVVDAPAKASASILSETAEASMPETSAVEETKLQQTQAQQFRLLQQAASSRLFASPLARRIASQNNLSLDGIVGSGPNGRIIKVDVEDV